MKKSASIILSLMLLAALLLAGCGSPDSSTVSGPSAPPSTDSSAFSGTRLRVWAPSEELLLLEELCASFAAQHPDVELSFEYTVVGEQEVLGLYQASPATAADVFVYSSTVAAELAAEGILMPVAEAGPIAARNTAAAVAAATLNDTLYGYPLGLGTGCVLYYDSRVFQPEEVQSLETLLDAAQENDKKVAVNLSDGWYLANFFLTAGCSLGVDAEGNTSIDFNSPAGLSAAEALATLASHPAFLLADDPDILAAMGQDVAATISGSWNASQLETALGDGFAAAALPLVRIGGQESLLRSYSSYRLVGVNSGTPQAELATALADYISDEAAQLQRFAEQQLPPTNLAAAANEAVQTHPVTSALLLQNEVAVVQPTLPTSYWEPAALFGTQLPAPDQTQQLQSLLDELVQKTLGQ